MSDWKLSHSLGLLVYLPTWWQLCVGWVRFIRRNSNLAPIIPTCHKNSRTLPSYFHQFVFTTWDTLIIATTGMEKHTAIFTFILECFTINSVVTLAQNGSQKLFSQVLTQLVSKWQGCLRQHCRHNIREYWLSWTNTVSEQKIPITILILKQGPCLGCLWLSFTGHSQELSCKSI